MLQIFLLGTPQLILDGNPLHTLTSVKSQALLYYLAISRRPESRLILAGLLWPEKTDTEARTNLRQAVRQLRQTLGDQDGGYLITTRDTVALPDTQSVEVDAVAFEWMVNAGLRGQKQVLQLAVDRYAGDFLSGFYLDDAYGFEEWMLTFRERLRSLAILGLHNLVNAFAESHEITTGLTYARRLLELEPWREEAHRLMMQFLAWDGQTSAALAQFDTCRQILTEELGVPPSPETRALYDAIRANQTPRKTARKDEPPPQRARALPPHNLPSQQTPFIGRVQESRTIQRLLTPQADQEKKPLVTLKGMGGVGKTRMAVQIGQDLLPYFSDGVWFIELAATTEPAQVPQAIVSTLSLREGTEQPSLEIIQEHFRARTALLILDNCEQVLAACAEIAQTLQTHCPFLTLLVTSREPLHLPNETVFPMPVMETPDPEHLPPFDKLIHYDSVRLFVERARVSWPAFPYTAETAPFIAEICKRLDGIPLALELAAVRVNALSVEKIAQRLGHRFRLLTHSHRTSLPRHQTLFALVDWSYDLLEPEERTLLQRLSVFSGSWTLEAAETICSFNPEGKAYTQPLHPMDVLDLLTRLVDKSLVQVPEFEGENTRYRLLETIRQYAHGKLREGGEAATAVLNHGLYYMNLVLTANPALKGAEQARWMARLHSEQDNIRAAFNGWLQNKPGFAVLMAGALGRYWDRQGFYTEGRETLDQALLAAQAVSPADKLKALKWSSALAMRQGNFAKANPIALDGLALARTEGDKVSTASFLNLLGIITIGQNDQQAARKYIEESVDVQRELGNQWGVAVSLGNLCGLCRETGYTEEALQYIQEAVEISRHLGDRNLIASHLDGLAECYLELSDPEKAQTYLEEAHAIQHELGDQQGTAYTLSDLGIVAWIRKSFKLAQDYFDKSLAIRQEIGDQAGEGYLHHLIGMNALGAGDAVTAKQHLHAALAILHALGDERNSINCVEEIGFVAQDLGNPVKAVKIWAATHAWRQVSGVPVRGYYRAFHEEKHAQICSQLDEQQFQSAWEAGSQMSFAQVVAFAKERAG